MYMANLQAKALEEAIFEPSQSLSSVECTQPWSYHRSMRHDTGPKESGLVRKGDQRRAPSRLFFIFRGLRGSPRHYRQS